GAAVLGRLADHVGIDPVYQICAFLPLLGLLAAFLPDVHKYALRPAGVYARRVNLLPRALLAELAARAAASPRARAHHNIHATPDDLVQRFIVVARPDSYFRPHRHAARSELALLLHGRVDVLTFDARGRVL